jgi:protein-S-isoprenylcysteine O-methyltransferase Ste14
VKSLIKLLAGVFPIAGRLAIPALIATVILTLAFLFNWQHLTVPDFERIRATLFFGIGMWAIMACLIYGWKGAGMILHWHRVRREAARQLVHRNLPPPKSIQF